MRKSMKKWISSLTSSFSSSKQQKQQQQGVNSSTSSSGGKKDGKGKSGLQGSRSGDSTASSLAVSSFPRCACTHFASEENEELLPNGDMGNEEGGEEGVGEDLGEAGRVDSMKEALGFAGHHQKECPIRTTALKEGDVMYRDVAAEVRDARAEPSLSEHRISRSSGKPANKDGIHCQSPLTP